MYSLNDFSGYQHCLGEGGAAMHGTPKLEVTGHRFPKHKRTLQTLFSYLSQKILARIVDEPVICDGRELQVLGPT